MTFPRPSERNPGDENCGTMKHQSSVFPDAPPYQAEEEEGSNGKGRTRQTDRGEYIRLLEAPAPLATVLPF